MDTRQLEYILEIAEAKSLSKAAEHLFITQSALSQLLNKLKKQGLPPLFVYQKQQMLLTDAGKIYVDGARTILKLEQEAQTALQDLAFNHVQTFHICICPHMRFLFYSEVLPQIRRHFPNTTIQCHIIPDAQIRLALESNELQMAIFPSLSNTHAPFTCSALNQDELVIAVASHMQQAELPMILPEPGTSLRDICDYALLTNRIHPVIYAETNDLSLALKLTLSGECTALIPRSMLSDPDLNAISFSEPCFFYLLAISNKNYHSPVTDAVIKEMEWRL